jgi:uncharacterized membrane protein (DUF485 family)
MSDADEVAQAGHPPDPIHDDHHAPTIARNARVGLWLFAVYVVLYAGFMVLSAFYPERMRASAVAGVNLAVAYGFALIIGAFLLALVYMFLVRARAADENAAEGR